MGGSRFRGTHVLRSRQGMFQGSPGSLDSRSGSPHPSTLTALIYSESIRLLSNQIEFSIPGPTFKRIDGLSASRGVMLNVNHTFVSFSLKEPNRALPALQTASDRETNSPHQSFGVACLAPPPNLQSQRGRLASASLRSPPTPCSLHRCGLSEAFALSPREASEGAFILLHTSLKRSQVKRGCRDPPRAALTGGAKAASCSVTRNTDADFSANYPDKAGEESS